jgi:hypothetical protein
VITGIRQVDISVSTDDRTFDTAQTCLRGNPKIIAAPASLMTVAMLPSGIILRRQ